MKRILSIVILFGMVPGWLLRAEDDPYQYHEGLYPSPSFTIFHPPSQG